MRKFLVITLGLLGCIIAISLSLYALLKTDSSYMSPVRDSAISSMVYSIVALIGLILVKFTPKLGGF
jgi:hypothetical protein